MPSRQAEIRHTDRRLASGDQSVAATIRAHRRQEFAGRCTAFRHRYALALHSDEPHPYVHVVVKAMSEECVRLNIRKATLRQWREAFARHLYCQGVAAKAT
jgi:hypothetical protein